MSTISIRPKQSIAPASSKNDLLSRRAWWGLLFVLPVAVFFAIFSIYPIVNGFYLSLTDFSLLKVPVYIGFDNYTRIFNDRQFQNAMVVTIKLLARTSALRVVALDPERPHGYFLLAQCSEALNDSTTAIHYYRETVKRAANRSDYSGLLIAASDKLFGR